MKELRMLEDQLNDEIKKATTALVLVGYDVSAAINLGHGTALHFMRWGREWAFVYSTKEDKTTPLVEMPLERKFTLVPQMKYMLDAVRKEYEAQLKEVKLAITEAQRAQELFKEARNKK